METKIGLIIFSFSVFFLFLYAWKYLNKTQTFIFFLITYGLAVTTYLSYSIYYYHYKQNFHPFDPYYQVSPPEFNVPFLKDTNEFRILALGGSTTRDSQKPVEFNYPYKLQKLLQQKYPSKKITVLNGGMNWHTSKHTLMFYTEYGNLFHPDLVIVMDAINDVYRSFSPPEFAVGGFHPSYNHYYGPSIHGAVLNTLEHAIVNKTLRANPNYKEAKFNFNEFLAFESFKKNESTLVKYILSDNTPCLLLMQPSLYNDHVDDSIKNELWFGKYFCNKRKAVGRVYPDASSMKMAMDSFTNAVRDIALQKGTWFLDANREIPKTLEYFTDDVHYTDAGVQKLATLVYEFINSEKIITNTNKP